MITDEKWPVARLIPISSEILPGLAGVPIERIASETGLSLAHVWRIRKGERTPHPRYWPALAALAQMRSA